MQTPSLIQATNISPSNVGVLNFRGGNFMEIKYFFLAVQDWRKRLSVYSAVLFDVGYKKNGFTILLFRKLSKEMK